MSDKARIGCGHFWRHHAEHLHFNVATWITMWDMDDLTESQAARLLSLSAVELAELRKRGEGPPFTERDGERIYRRADLVTWVDSLPREPY